MLCFVERKALGRVGADATAPLVVSRRNSQEKKPWKSLPGIENQVEAEFLRPTLLGESILPYRVFQPFEAVIPATAGGDVLDSKTALDRGFDRLAGWMRKAEAVWDDNNSANMLFKEWLDYFGKLTAQFPIPATTYRLREGRHTSLRLASCETRHAVIEHKLYWSAPAGLAEARYLAADP